jgi:hypothetical protein
MAIYGYGASGRMAHRHYRLTVLEFRGQPLDAPWPGFAALGLLRDGCPLLSRPARPLPPPPGWGGGPAAALSLNGTGPVPLANGWFFAAPAAAPAAADPVRFVLEGSDDGEAWAVVGSSSFVAGEGGRLGFLHGPHATRGGGADNVFDLRPSGVWLASWLWPFLISGCVYWASACLALVGRNKWIRPLAVGSYLHHGAVLAVCAALHALALPGAPGGDRGRAAAACLARATCRVSIGALMWLAERRFVYLVGAVGLQAVVVELLVQRYVEHGALLPLNLLLAAFVQLGLAEAVFSTLALSARRHFLAAASGLVRGDRAVYQELWARLLQQPGHRQALEDLAALARPFEGGPRPRQYALPPDAPPPPASLHASPAVPQEPGSFDQAAGAAPASWGALAAEDEGGVVTCVDQLMVKAVGLDSLLRELCQRWAVPSRAHFLCASGGRRPAFWELGCWLPTADWLRPTVLGLRRSGSGCFFEERDQASGQKCCCHTRRGRHPLLSDPPSFRAVAACRKARAARGPGGRLPGVERAAAGRPARPARRGLGQDQAAAARRGEGGAVLRAGSELPSGPVPPNYDLPDAH